jgi:hypothetical protein
MILRTPPLLTFAVVACVFSTQAAFAACHEQSLGGPAKWKRAEIASEKWARDPAQDDPKNWNWSAHVDLGGGKAVPILYRATHMGNGTIQLKNLMLRIYRRHMGGSFTFSPYALRVRLAPRPSGCRLSVSGNINLLDQDGEKIVGHKQADLVYDYDSGSDKFQIVPGHKRGFGEIDLSQ